VGISWERVLIKGRTKLKHWARIQFLKKKWGSSDGLPWKNMRTVVHGGNGGGERGLGVVWGVEKCVDLAN